MPTVDDSDNLRLFAARSLLTRLQALMSESEGVKRAEDIEFIHRMRVATRRLRAALAAFEDALPSKPSRRWRKGVRRLTRALGPARDLDVQIEFLQQFLAEQEDKQSRPGVERLLLRLRQQRAELQPDLIKAIERAERPDELRAMSEALCQIVADAESGDGRPGLHDTARAAILRTLEEFVFHAPCVHHPEQVQRHHQMRIAAKRLRYAMEIFEPVFDRPIDTYIKQVKQLQSVLGSLHDCDVWLEMLPQFIEDERRRTIAFQGHARGYKRIEAGLNKLLANRDAERNKLYDKFVARWEKLDRRGTWDGIRKLVRNDTDVEPPSAGTAAGEPDAHADHAEGEV